MQNEINISDNKIPPVEKNGEAVPKKSGINFWIISTIIVSILLTASIVFIFAFKSQSSKKSTPNITIIPTQTPNSLPTKKPIEVINSENPTKTDGKYMGYIKKVYQKNSKYYVDIDYVQWLTDGVDKTFSATRACVEDKKCQVYDETCEIDINGNCIANEWSFCDGNKCAKTRCGIDKSCLPNGYYIRNQDPKIRTFEISSQATIENLQKEVTSPTKITMEDLLNIFNGTDEERRIIREAPYNIVVENGLLIKIFQQYRP